VRSVDGRVLALMPHPERTVLGGVGSWIAERGLVERGNGGSVSGEELWGDFGPWSRLFMSARRWVG